MSPEPTPAPTPVAGESSLSLETEPLVFFHPTLAGMAPNGKVQPIPGPIPMEEEPATWAEPGG